jgi:hypothetical protein
MPVTKKQAALRREVSKSRAAEIKRKAHEARVRNVQEELEIRAKYVPSRSEHSRHNARRLSRMHRPQGHVRRGIERVERLGTVLV